MQTRPTTLPIGTKTPPELPQIALAVGQRIELHYRGSGGTSLRVPLWENPPDIIEWQGRRFVKETNSQYREAITVSLYVGYNAESMSDDLMS